MAESRSYGPTQRRLAEARAEGRVAKSPVLTAALCATLLALGGGVLCTDAIVALAAGFSAWPTAIARIAAGGASQPSALLAGFGTTLSPMLWFGVTVALGAGFLQVGARFTPRALGSAGGKGGRALGGEFDATRFWGEFAVTVLVVVVGAGVFVVLAHSEFAGIVTLMQRSPVRALGLVGALLGRLLATFGAFLCVLAVLDWARRRHVLLRSLRMTRSEIDRERRELEANPRLRARQRQVQRAPSHRNSP